MKINKAFHLASNIFLHSKLRSWLTIIGIIIGIASIVSIVSISQGAEQQVKSRLSGLGADIITVSPGFSRAAGPGGSFGGGGGTGLTNQKNLTSKDILVLKNVPGVLYVLGTVSDRGDLSISGKTATVSVTGVDESVWKYVTTETLSSGRLLTQGDAYSVVLGGNLVNRTFGGSIVLNSQVTIQGKIFKVVGITTEGNTAYIPISIAREILTNVGRDSFNSIQVKISSVDLSAQIVQDITDRLKLSRGILSDKKQDFSVSSPVSFQQTLTSTLNTISLFLGAIAAISLIVGGIGIANTMFTSVLEKTRDIGIMKAIGAKNSEIMTIFLLNAGLIGFVGGLGGIILGAITSTFINDLGGISSGGGRGGLGFLLSGSSIITPDLVIYSLLFSVVIGMIAGAIPAYRASKLNPVDALRYE